MIGDLLQWLGYGLCHQLPERSFFGGGVQVPVCARDTGIYIGFVLSLVLIALIERGRRRTEFPRPWLMVVGVVFLGAMALDGITSYAGLRETTNAIRLATGLLAGWALPLLVVPMINGSLWADPQWGRVLDDWREGAVWLIPLPFAFTAVYLGGPYLGVAYPLAVAAAILVTFTAVNLIIVALMPPFERKAYRLREAWVALLIALGLGIAEIAASAALRVVLQSLGRLG
jgi:uncharacterized membrane protein